VSALTLVVALGIFTLDMLSSAKNDFTIADLVYIKIALGIVSAFLALMLLLSHSLSKKSANLINALTAIAFAAAVFSINWSMVEAVILLPGIVIFCICAVFTYFVFIILNLRLRNRAITLFFVLTVFLVNDSEDFIKDNIFEARDIVVETITSTSIRTGIDEIIFDERPDIYFISFDSIHPKSLTSLYMNIEETGFHVPIYSRMDVFENLFSPRIFTKNAMNVLMRMKVEGFDKLGNARYDFYPGQREGRLGAIFRNNGYEINTFYQNKYFGPRKGEFVDRYKFASNKNLGACELNKSKYRFFSLMGLCYYLDVLRNKDVSDVNESNKTKGKSLIEFISFLLA